MLRIMEQSIDQDMKKIQEHVICVKRFKKT